MFATANNLQYFASLICEATSGSQTRSLAEMHAMRASAGHATGPFGNVAIDYTMANGETAGTIAEVGKIELETIETLLGRVLSRARSDSNTS